MTTPRTGPRSASRGAATGAALGLLCAVPALVVAVLSAGAGHGDYALARALFPVPMLMTLLEGSIGPFAAGAALLQFPLYGALVGWSRARRRANRALVLLASLHLAAAIACFSGLLPNFS